MSKTEEKNTVISEVKEIADSAWGFFVFNRRMAVMLVLIFLVTGIFSFFKMPRESEPEVKVPYASVMTAYSGASPTEVAQQVTFKIEQRIKSLENLKNLTSTSSEGISQIFVEFEADADIDDSIRKLRDRIEGVKSALPDDANDPSVQELSFSSRPIMTLSFFSDLPYERLLGIVEDVQDEIEKNAGVQSAVIAGKKEKHILVSVRDADMMKHNLSLQAINRAISVFHMNSPVGNIESDEMMYRVRIESEQDTADHVKDIPIFSKNGAVIYVKDVANVAEVFKEATTMSRVSKNGEPSKPAISINVVKKTGANIIKTADEIKASISRMQKDGIIPDRAEYLVINDMAKYVRDDFNRLMKNGLQTIVIIFFVLLIALGFKEALVGGIAIPFTFFVTFTYLYQTGNTFNFLVLFSLILGLGLLVDTTIVMMEGIHEFMHTKKLSPINAVLMAIKTYRYPLMSGMLTTISAFIPMLMMSGIMGQFFKYIPITVSAVLISSFVIGLFIIPAYAVIFMKNDASKDEQTSSVMSVIKNKRKRCIGFINEKYKKFLDYILGKRKRRVALLAISLLTFASAVLLPVMGLVKVEGFPLVDIDFMFIDLKAPVGTTLSKLDPIVKKAEEVLQKDSNVDSYVINMGMGGPASLEGDLGPSATSSHLANFSINFTEEENRTDKSYIIAEGYKDKLAFITEADVTVPELRSGPHSGKAVQVRIFGDDYDVLKLISHDIQAKFEEWGGSQAGDDMSTGTAEFTFDFSDSYTKALLSSRGLNVMDTAREVRMAVYPTKAAVIKRGDEEIDVDVQRDWGGYRPESIDDVKSIQIQSPVGGYVSLGSLSIPDVGASLTSIKHFDGDRVITVFSDVGQGQVPADLLNKLEPYLNSYAWPSGYSYKMGGGNEDTMQSFMDLFKAMGIAVFLIFFILIAQFNSFKQPFVVLMALPLSTIGVLYGFMIFRLNVGVATMIGVVALTGIVINDAIVLIDRININRREKGMSVSDAIKEAGPARLQPIIITSVTTILGILPISLTDPFWLTLGMAIVFGMAFSTVLTLIIIPVLYYVFEAGADKKELFNNKEAIVVR